MQKLLVFGVFLFATTNLFATENVQSDYSIISNVEVFEDVVTDCDLDNIKIDFAAKSLINSMSEMGEVIQQAEELIAVGKAVWQVVKDNKAVVNALFRPSVHVLPISDEENIFFKMSNWSIPKFKKYKVIYQNLLGMDVVRFSFLVKAQHGGQYNGKGQYLADVSIVPTQIDVLWGYTFNALTEVVYISNRGTMDEPIAGITLSLKHSAEFLALNHFSNAMQFHISGNGEILLLD